ncbi:MAG TPA: universal stress protein [Candidatus Binataceae bacterium]|nr:universal stress protein [Candidatus Binataceae bacterium]
MATHPEKDDLRPDPESFLDLVVQPLKGRLKIYIGAAAGVGKTYKMLEEAHQLRAKGVDVVVGLVETHNRAETLAKVGDLEIVPRRAIEYRGTRIEEMDIDAIVARKPELVIVDELAHTNAPGSRHEKRYQDIEELMTHGISVITAINIQHIETLNPLMKRITGIDVREVVPDSFIAKADQIVNIDVTVEQLRERLREGKIYPAAQVEQALKNFFKPSNLTSLRELTLREVARGINRQREEQEALRREGGRRRQVFERVMVGLSSNPEDGKRLLHKAARIAGQLNADWFAVHIETPAESVRKIDTRSFVALLDNINLAGELGAETVWLKAPDPVKAMLEFARERGVEKVIIGRTHQPFWRRWLGKDITERLLAEAKDLDIEIVGDQALEEGEK